jgi:hypothetical protein
MHVIGEKNGVEKRKEVARENRTVLFATEKGNLATALSVRLCMSSVLFSFIWLYILMF